MKVENIKGIPLTDEEKRWRNYQRRVMIKMGMLPTYYTSGCSKIRKHITGLSKEQFSTNYKISKEFIDDRDLISKYLLNNEYIPDALVKKVSETVEELNIEYDSYIE